MKRKTNKLKLYRNLRNISQQKLADMVGVGRSTIVNIEGNSSPDIDIARKIAVALDVDVNILFPNS